MRCARRWTARARARLRRRRQRAAGRQRAEPGAPRGAAGRRRADRAGITLNDVCLACMSAVAMGAAMIRAEEATAVLVGGFDSMTRAPHALRLRPGAADGRRADGRRDGPRRAVLLDRRRGHGRHVGRRERAPGRHAARRRTSWPRARTPAPPRVAKGSRRRSSPLDGLTHDEGVRDTSLEALAELPPAFTADGTITAGNASQVSDGAAAAVMTTRGPRAGAPRRGRRPSRDRRAGLDAAPAARGGLAEAARSSTG